MFRKRIALLTIFCLTGLLSARGQYYYQDIYQTIETNNQHQENLKNHVKQIQILSFDTKNQPIKDFKCLKNFSANYQKVTTITQSSSTGTDYLTSYFDEKGRIIYTQDSSVESINHSRMYYNDSTGQIDSLAFLSYAADSQKGRKTSLPLSLDTLRETHVFYYSPSGKLQKMTRIKSGQLYKTIHFKTDSIGHIHKEYQDGKSSPIYYYQYKGDKLANVFHYSYLQKKMIPNYLFDYDTNGRLKQKTVVMTNAHDFLEWHYTYNEEGLISKQVCYDRRNVLQGNLIFKYSYLP